MHDIDDAIVIVPDEFSLGKAKQLFNKSCTFELHELDQKELVALRKQYISKGKNAILFLSRKPTETVHKNYATYNKITNKRKLLFT